MVIIGIVGILDFPRSEDRVWKKLHKAFIDRFPDATFVVEHSTYVPWQSRKMRSFAESILQKYDEGEELLLVGYSLGGIIACSIAQRFKKSRLKGIVTIGSPHKINVFYKMLAASRVVLQVPVYTFAGIFDPLVPWFITTYPGDRHVNLLSDHLLYFVLSEKPARLIAQTVKDHQPELS